MGWEKKKTPEVESSPSQTVQPPTDFSIIVVGSNAVGKSAASVQYIQKFFVERYDSTIEDIYRKPKEVDGQEFRVTVVDTAGQEAFATMRGQYFKSANAVIFMFSLTDKKSFDDLEKIVSECHKIREAHVEESKVPCVLVGTKTDLLETEKTRKVSTEEGRAFAKKIDARCYLEISNKNEEEVRLIFDEAVRSGSKILKEKRVQGRLECLRIQRFGGKENRIAKLFREEFAPLRLTASFCGASLRAANNVKEDLALKKK